MRHYNWSKPAEHKIFEILTYNGGQGICLGCATFLKGKTSAHFHNLSTLPFMIDALKMEQIGMHPCAP